MPTNFTLQAADSVSAHALLDAFNRAYQHYYRPLKLTLKAFRNTIAREAVNLEASVVALDGQNMVGLALLGIRGRCGWIGGVGVIPTYRRRGIARAMMEYLLEIASQRGLQSVQLEVVERNHEARPLYESLGFREQRQLFTFSRQVEQRRLQSENGPAACRVHAISPGEGLTALSVLDGVQRAWSRDVDALWPFANSFKALGAFRDEDAAGVCLFSTHSRKINLVTLAGTSVAADALLQALHLVKRDATINYFNVPADDPLLPELSRAGYQQTLKQLEMVYSV